MRIVTVGPGRVPSSRCDLPAASMMVSWPSPTTRARTRANSIAVPSGRSLYSVEMLIQMAFSRQRPDICPANDCENHFNSNCVASARMLTAQIVKITRSGEKTVKRRAALKTGLAFGAGVLILRRAEAQSATLNLYSARHYNTDEALYGNFADLSGVKINRVDAEPDPLLERLKSEGDKSPCDVFITVD